jgi:hypothetical protein
LSVAVVPNLEQSGFLQIACHTRTEIEALKGQGFDITSQAAWMPLFSNSTDRVQPRCSYFYDPNAVERIVNYLSSVVFDGRLTLKQYPNNTLAYEYSSDLITKIYQGDSPEFQDVAALYSNATGALDRQIRQSGYGEYSTPARGIIYGASTCLEVQWLWLIYPSAFTGLVLVFFLVLIFETMPSGQENETRQEHDFKGSPLALLFHGFEGGTLAALDDGSASNKKKDLEKVAKTMRVRLVNSRHGWKFSDDRVRSPGTE